MENQINSSDQSINQIDQFPDKPTEIKIKSKINFWMVSTAILTLLFIIMIGVFASNYFKTKNSQSYLPSPTPETNQPPAAIKQELTSIPTTTPTTNVKLEDFINKELLGENNNYSVYLINQKGDTPEKIGEIIVYDKKNQAVIKITGTVSIFGATIVIDDNKGEYVLLSTGTNVSRTIIPLSLVKENLVATNFCATSLDFLFYKDYVIYGNCDTFQNRPWAAGEAASLIALNLKTGQDKKILKSDLTHQYGLTKIAEDTLHYLETFVINEEDWQNPDNQKTVQKTYSLLSL
ncbi:hypothetical protein KKE34_05390 [Patescibacteria group bacterium]|nr:hypothetical protein [Patescibacteria group bacterium]